MIRYFMIFLTFVLTTNLSAQTTTGFFGKRFLVEMSGSASYPLFWKPNGPLYKSNGNSLVSASKVPDVGFKGQVSFAITDRFMMGIEFAQHRMFISGTEEARAVKSETGASGFKSYYTAHVRQEQLTCIARDINLKFEIGSQGNLFPSGLSHQFGLGIAKMWIKGKDYDSNFSSSQFEEENRAALNDYTHAFSGKSVTGVTIFYEIHMRTPLTKWLLLSYGIRVNGNFIPESHALPNPGDIDTPFFKMHERRIRNFSSANIGLSFIF